MSWKPSEAILRDTTDSARRCLDIVFTVMLVDTTDANGADSAARVEVEGILAQLQECSEVDRDRVTKKTLEWIADLFPQALVYGPNLVCYSYHHAAFRLARHVHMAWDVVKSERKRKGKIRMMELAEAVRTRGIALTKREIYELGASLTVEARKASKAMADQPSNSDLPLLENERVVLEMIGSLERPSRLKEFLPRLEAQGIGESTAKGILSDLRKRGLLLHDGGYCIPPKV